MICEKCQGRVSIVQTFSAGPGGKTQAGVCDGCLTRYTFVVLALEAKKNGTGARSYATRLKNGEPVSGQTGRYSISCTPRSSSRG